MQEIANLLNNNLFFFYVLFWIGRLTIPQFLLIGKTNLWCVVDLEKFPIIQQLSLLVLLDKNLLLRTLTLALIQASEARAYLAPIAKLKKTKLYKNTKPKSMDFEKETLQVENQCLKWRLSASILCWWCMRFIILKENVCFKNSDSTCCHQSLQLQGWCQSQGRGSSSGRLQLRIADKKLFIKTKSKTLDTLSRFLPDLSRTNLSNWRGKWHQSQRKSTKNEDKW